MKLLNKPIDMISWTSLDGAVTPVRFRMEENGNFVVVKIARIMERRSDRFAGSPTLIFRCMSIYKGVETLYELTYNCHSQKWLLKKM